MSAIHHRMEAKKALLDAASAPERNGVHRLNGHSALREFGLFARNFLRHPFMLGTVFPSSRFLVRRALSHVPWDECRVIVEYGPGVGQFTREILHEMRLDAVLVSIEINGEFVRFLQRELPDRRMRVVEGSAADVRAILQREGLSAADCVVAGIPFRALSGELTREIVRETHGVLRPGGTLVVYQYSKAVLPYLESTFGRVESDFEPRNYVPARVFRCRKHETPAREAGVGANG